MKNTKSKARKLIPIGGSVGITVPKPFLEKNSLKKGDQVGVVFNDVLLICVPRLPGKKQVDH